MRTLQYALAMPSGLVVNGVKDALAAALGILESAKEEVVWLVPPAIHTLSMTHGFFEKTKAFIQQGGVSRGVVSITPANAEEIQMSLDAGDNIRHSDKVHELFMYVGDEHDSVSSINMGIQEFTLDTPAVAYWSESPVYAEYLLASFENVWTQAVPAEGRLREILGRGPSQA